MNRNKVQIHSRTDIARAALVVVEIVKLLRLSRKDLERMFREDVIDHIRHGDHPGFLPYAEGMRDAYITAIIKDHCEFVYFVGGERLTLDEVRQKGPGELAGSVCGYQWLGSECDFTEFHKEVDLWI